MIIMVEITEIKGGETAKFHLNITVPMQKVSRAEYGLSQDVIAGVQAAFDQFKADRGISGESKSFEYVRELKPGGGA